MRFNDRDFEMLSWLNYLNHLNLMDFRDSFFKKGTNPRRYPYRKLLKLIRAGYVTNTKIPVEAKDLYLPTEKSVKLLRDEGMPYALGLSKSVKKKEFANYRHDRVLIRLWILFKDLGIGIYVPERVIRSIKPRGARPDAVIVARKEAYAIEYERSAKEPFDRYKAIFERYRGREHYDRVLYLTESRALIRKIEDKFRDLANVYFITREELFEQKDEAVFRFQTKTFPLKRLIQDSQRGSLQDLERRFLRKIICPKPDESWKDVKPFIPWPKGGGGKSGEGGEGMDEERSDCSEDPPDDPTMYSAGEGEAEDGGLF